MCWWEKHLISTSQKIEIPPILACREMAEQIPSIKHGIPTARDRLSFPCIPSFTQRPTSSSSPPSSKTAMSFSTMRSFAAAAALVALLPQVLALTISTPYVPVFSLFRRLLVADDDDVAF